MTESGLRRFWNAIKPPPPAPSRPSQPSYSRPNTLWDALKPPPAVYGQDEVSPAARRRRKRILMAAAVVILMGAGAWRGYVYVASAPQRAEAVQLEGMRFMASGKNTQAVERFTRATNIWPQLATGYLERGLARLNLGDTQLAFADFQQAIKVDPNLTEAHTALGSIYRQRGDVSSALNEFTRAINLGSAVEANYQRGQLYESLGQHQKALDDYNLAIAQLPDAPYVYRARAVARESLGDRSGADGDRHAAYVIEHPYAHKPAAR